MLDGKGKLKKGMRDTWTEAVNGMFMKDTKGTAVLNLKNPIWKKMKSFVEKKTCSVGSDGAHTPIDTYAFKLEDAFSIKVLTTPVHF